MNRLIKSLFTFLVLMTALTPGFSLALLTPSLIKMEFCLKETPLSGVELASILLYPDIFVNEFRDNDDSTDKKLFKIYDLSGFLSPVVVLKNSWRKPPSNGLLLTGNMYFRKASIFEKFIGGGSDKYFYEAIMNSKRYLLLSSYIVRPTKNRCHSIS